MSDASNQTIGEIETVASTLASAASVVIPGAQIIPAIQAGIALVEQLTPMLEAAFSSGAVSAADSQALFNRIEAMSANLHAAFTGSEWLTDDQRAAIAAQTAAVGNTGQTAPASPA